jgi:hypothetical protein
MAEYRNRTTGEVKSQGEIRRDHPNMSIPRVWNDGVCDALNVDPVLPGTRPTPGQYQTVRRDGVEQNDAGDWVEKWVVADMFADGEDGTKAEKEAAYQATLDANIAAQNRTARNDKLAETDFWGMSDMTMSAEMTTYRQALRDITTHSNWPNLEEGDWPTKP